MRESCFDCARKHIGQALVLLIEAKLGYPEYKWLAIGHLAEAEAETVKDFFEVAVKIRGLRHEIMDNEKYNVDLLALIREITELQKVFDCAEKRERRGVKSTKEVKDAKVSKTNDK